MGDRDGGFEVTDAKKISQLISQSLRQQLTDTDSEMMDEHLKEDSQTRNFKELSKLIQDSVSHGATEVNDSTVAGMSEDTKEKMRASVAAATLEKRSLSQAGLLKASTPPGGRSSTRLGEPGVETTRRVSSKFRLIRRLGEGGLGNVWLARDEQLNRNVAVKELNEDALESPQAWRRFHREAEITGQLEHPNIVPIYQFGDDRESGEPFYTMRFVGKRTLADAIVEHHDRISICESDAIALHRLLSVFLDICQAIAYAHSRGVVHRDLKPENVALDNFGQVIVLDWGLAKVTDDCELSYKLTSNATMTDSTMTHSMQGDVIGTPRYMAPEQAAGDLDRINEQTDVYGLGAILFAILTGQAPHDNSAAGSKQLSQVLKTIVEGDTPVARDLQPCLPSELDDICRKAMAKKPHLRYDGVQELAAAVEKWMAGQSEKSTRYESLRMEGRELRAELQSLVSDLERNTRFMSRLPPIQQLIVAESDKDITDWRDRLATIFQGLLEANPNYKTVVYNRIDGDTFSELVRVERHSREASRIRVVPKSRLRKVKLNDFMSLIAKQKPEEVVTSLVSDPTCESSEEGCEDTVGLVAGVPVFDEQTEEVFGVVMIDCDINSFLRQQMSRNLTAGEAMAACDRFDTMMHYANGGVIDGNQSRPYAEVAPHFSAAVESLQTELEYIDDSDSEIYGARIWLIPNKHGLMYLLRRKAD